jgi:hypothetical protein
MILGCASGAPEFTDQSANSFCASAENIASEVRCGSQGQLITLPYQSAQIPTTCTHALGSLHFPDALADGFDSIRDLRRVDGTFTLFRPHSLADLQGLAKLEVVGGTFSIDLGPLNGLASLEGVGKLREVGSLTLSRMPKLKTLAPFRCLKVIHGDLLIEDMPTLAQSEIEAFLARVRVEGKTEQK